MKLGHGRGERGGGGRHPGRRGVGRRRRGGKKGRRAQRLGESANAKRQTWWCRSLICGRDDETCESEEELLYGPTTGACVDGMGRGADQRHIAAEDKHLASHSDASLHCNDDQAVRARGAFRSITSKQLLKAVMQADSNTIFPRIRRTYQLCPPRASVTSARTDTMPPPSVVLCEYRGKGRLLE